MEAFINAVAPVALFIFITGIGIRLGRWFMAATTPRRQRGITEQFNGGPQPIGLWQALKEVIVNPVTHFGGRANRTWAHGYLFYHIAIITKAIGYGMAALIVGFHVLMQNPVPDVAAHTAASYNYSPANLLALIFGNGEHLQATFLFGDLSTAFLSITWVALAFAVAGNLQLLYTAIRKRSGAVIAGIDEASKDLRTGGWMKWDRVLVRLMIFTIIWTELLARLQAVEGIVFAHAFLGLSLLTIMPFTYLFHMVYNFLALFYAVRRKMARAVA
jgi:hypothetical protein